MNPTSLIRPRVVTTLVAAAITIFAGVQFVRPELKNSTKTSKLNVPQPIALILQTACFNCHSSETKLAWFDQIVPAYWFVARHVKEGRSYLNFSDLGKQPVAQQNAALFESFNQMQFGAMPPTSYLLVHPEARIPSAQLEVFRAYLESLEFHQASDPQTIAETGIQYAKWRNTETPRGKVQPAPNGIDFPADYKNWQVVSSTDRPDNNTMRVILGNEIAVNAIVARQINPWPDGAIFAKVAWWKLVDTDGLVHAGAFKQVEFMIKDSRKYAETQGWGWARWLGTDLKPFGMNRTFTTSCINCHLPMGENDLVFTMPIKSQP